jgi:NADH-quinone oxidoreductase subunit J
MLDEVLVILLTVLLVLGAMLTAMTARLLRAAIMLAVTSAVLTLIMFRLNAPLAAVFELSVCAGLVPAIFISAIGLTRRLDAEAVKARFKERLKRYWLLPVLLVAVAAGMSQIHFVTDFIAGAPDAPRETVRTVFWNSRPLDLLGQVAALLGAAFAVVVLLKETAHD